MRTGFHWQPHVQLPVDDRMIVPFARPIHGEELHPFTVQHQFHLMFAGEALHVLIAVTGQAQLDLVLRIQRKGVVQHHAAAGAEGKVVEMLLLGEVSWQVYGDAAGGAGGNANRQTADFAGRG